MRRHDKLSARVERRGLVATAVALFVVFALSGCGEQLKRGFLPHGVTENSIKVTHLWNGAWIAALAVGVLVWGLTLYCVVRFRRGRDEVGLPEQMRYNVPIEILYTVVPVFMVAVLFAHTVPAEQALTDNSKQPDITVNVVAKQWSWDFNYVDANVYQAGTQADLTGQPGVMATLPTLYLPVNKRVQFVLTARDVVHSFWVPQFLQKLDVLPGQVNRFQVVPTEQGTFQGKCAELCGAYHSHMLFQVKVVSESEFTAQMARLKAQGNTGQLSNALSREGVISRDQQWLPKNKANQ